MATVFHHALFLGITHYVLWGWYFKVPFAWLCAGELSTVFLNLRWFYAVLERKATAAYAAASYAFSFSFLLTRGALYSWGVAHLWAERALWWGGRTGDGGMWHGLHLVVAGVHAGLFLNLAWSCKVVAGLRRGLREKAARPKAD